MKHAFTLAEVLITLLIIGIIAVLTIPSLISLYEQQQFKVGLRKAVNVINDSIAMNIAIENETPLTNKDTFNYLLRHMSVLSTTYTIKRANDYASTSSNLAFYTPDGIRFEFKGGTDQAPHSKRLHETDTVISLGGVYYNKFWGGDGTMRYGCGSYGLLNNPSNSTIKPCYIVVDVNGEKGPSSSQSANLVYKPDSDINSDVVGDVFTVLITENGAKPFGVIAQRAMYGK